MAIHKTEVIILRRQEIRETSLILIAFSRDVGKIHGLAKGVRGARAAVPWYLEPLTLQSIVFYERRRSPLGLLSSCDLIDPFDAIRRDFVRTAYASFCVDLVDAMTEVNDSHPEIFYLLLNALRKLEEGINPRQLARFFEVHLVREVGLLPETASLALSPEGNRLFRQILETPIDEMRNSPWSPHPESQLRLRFQGLVRGILHRELKSRIFLRALGLEGERPTYKEDTLVSAGETVSRPELSRK